MYYNSFCLCPKTTFILHYQIGVFTGQAVYLAKPHKKCLHPDNLVLEEEVQGVG